jgi:hypothetical protein
MKILKYNELDTSAIHKQFEKVVEALERSDFRSADVKKLTPTSFYRAKLNDRDRLLFQFAEYRGDKYILLLEVIMNHDYGKSRFLNGAKIDETKLETLNRPEEIKENPYRKLNYVNTARPNFNILDKIISFDDVQEEAFNLRPPLILVGSAGSGKTVLTLEKLKQLKDDILYVTRSQYLAENSRNLYYSFNYENEVQNIDFLSYKEYMESIHVPDGRALTFHDFEQWFSKYSYSAKIRDSHKLFEEFNGVITGMDIGKAFLSREEYLQLGVKRSIFNGAERNCVYDIFNRYLDLIKGEEGFYDTNIASFNLLRHCTASYDFVVVDEVQDITNVQLHLILKSLRQPENFILCGDSNQIVHPNFFSWTNVRSMFYEQKVAKGTDIIRILNTNYRNSKRITETANRLLLVKNARFGSIDRESNYLVKCSSDNQGELCLMQDTDKIKGELNTKTRQSAKFAIVVMRQEDKAEAARFFKTPLIFSVQEAKGLEYENIIIYNFISGNSPEFNEIIEGVTEADLNSELRYSRAKDKEDKSLEVFKFHINSLYVAITRSIRNIYIIEKNCSHRLLALLGISHGGESLKMSEQKSSDDEWSEEARKLELQGKKEQAERIRKYILKIQAVPWKILTPENLTELENEAFNPNHYNKQAKQLIYEYAAEYSVTWIFEKLLKFKFSKASNYLDDIQNITNKYSQIYLQGSHQELLHRIKLYGTDFRNQLNQTPLMIAAKIGSLESVQLLTELGANRKLRDNWGRTASQIALREAYLNHKYAAEKIAGIYPLLAETAINVKVSGKLLKIDARTMEYFLLNSMLALFQEIFRGKIRYNIPAFETGDFVSALQHFPDRIIPEHRKQRAYISGILSKNEVFRDDKYNRRIFLRITRGFYIPNPHMEIEVEEDKWINVFDLINISSLEKEISNRRLQSMLEVIRGMQKKDLSGFVENPDTI